MAQEDGVIVIGIELDDGTVKKAQVKANDLANAISKGFSGNLTAGIDKSFTGIAVQLDFIARTARAAFGVVSNVFGKAISEASGAEAAFNSLQIALGNIGADPAGAESIANLASELQRLGTVSDDAVVSAAQSLVSIGNLSGPALEKATKASVDLAAGLGVDLNTAFDLVAKSAAGNTAALSRYGIRLDENIPKNERFAAALNLINQRFGGFDAARANTFAGAVTKLGIAFDDIFESLGSFITQDRTLVAVLNFLTNAFGNIAERVSGFFQNNRGLLGNFIKDLINVAQVVNNVLSPAFDAFKNIAVIAFNAIKTGLQTILTGFAAVGLAVNSILNTIGVVSDQTLKANQAFFDQQKTALLESAQATSEVIRSELGEFQSLPITTALDEFLLKLETTAALAPELGAKIKQGVNVPAQQMADQYQSLRDSITKNFQQGVVNVISAGAQAIGASLVQGGKAFGSFFKTVLGIIGDLAIQIGTTLISIGLGIDALKTSLATLSGGVAIAAGLALVALGGLLKSIGGGGITANAAGGPASTPGGSTGGDVLTESPDLTRDRRQEVTIQVQGNILDRRESGLEIARVLQEYFDTNDGVLARS